MTTKELTEETASRPKVRLKLVGDLVEYSKSFDDYEELINDILRKYVDGAKESRRAKR